MIKFYVMSLALFSFHLQRRSAFSYSEKVALCPLHLFLLNHSYPMQEPSNFIVIMITFSTVFFITSTNVFHATGMQSQLTTNES